MIALERNDDTYTLKFTNNEIPIETIEKLILKQNIETILAKSDINENDALELSDEIKKSYFENNKKWIMEKIGADEKWT